MTSGGSRLTTRAALVLTVAACLVVSTIPLRTQAPDEMRILLDRFTAAFDNLDWPASPSSPSSCTICPA